MVFSRFTSTDGNLSTSVCSDGRSSFSKSATSFSSNSACGLGDGSGAGGGVTFGSTTTTGFGGTSSVGFGVASLCENNIATAIIAASHPIRFMMISRLEGG